MHVYTYIGFTIHCNTFLFKCTLDIVLLPNMIFHDRYVYLLFLKNLLFGAAHYPRGPTLVCYRYM